jgi:hypothetical protein
LSRRTGQILHVALELFAGRYDATGIQEIVDGG